MERGALSLSLFLVRHEERDREDVRARDARECVRICTRAPSRTCRTERGLHVQRGRRAEFIALALARIGVHLATRVRPMRRNFRRNCTRPLVKMHHGREARGIFLREAAARGNFFHGYYDLQLLLKSTNQTSFPVQHM